MTDTSTYKAKLEEERVRLEGDLSTIARPNPLVPNDWEPVAADESEPDPNLQADHMENFGENVAILEDLEVRYKDVQDALARIEAGTYGICEVGGEEIEAERLAADPAARTCLAHLNG